MATTMNSTASGFEGAMLTTIRELVSCVMVDEKVWQLIPPDWKQLAYG